MSIVILLILGFCLVGMIQQQAPQAVLRPLSWFMPDPDQLARHKDADEVRRRGEDMLDNGQHQPVGACEDGTLIFGHGRLLSAQAVQIKDLWVRIYPGKVSDTQKEIIRFAENYHRNQLTAYLKWQTAVKLMCGNAGWKQRDLAEALHISEPQAVRLLSPSKCVPAVQEALQLDRLGLSDCYELSRISESEQVELLAKKLGGASRDELARLGRQKRNGSEPAVKVNRIKIELASGVSVTFLARGDALDLDGAIEAGAEACRLMKKGQEQGLTAKTVQKVSAERAKAGG